MSEPRFLTAQQVQRLHARLIELFGGMHGLRDPHLFEAAVMHPRNVFYYAGGDLFDIAAAYAFHLAQAQAFLDGKKRIGAAAALTFLEANGVRLPTATDALYAATIGVAEKRSDKRALAELLRTLARCS